MNLRNFDLNLLIVLDALLREGSTVGAGRAVGLSQPAVSAALSRLRAAFGDPLLVRDGQRMRPTDLAVSIAGPLAQLLEDTGRLLSRPTFDPATTDVTFRMVAPDFFTEMLLPDLAARLRTAAPNARLRYTDIIGPQAFADLRDGRVDLVLVADLPFPVWVDVQPILRATWVLVARRDHPALRAAAVTPDRPMPLDLYGTLRHAVFRVVEDQPEVEDRILAELGRGREVALTVPNFSALWRAVAATDLVGIMPRRLAERVAGSAGLAIHPVPFDLPAVRLHQVWHRRNTATQSHAWFRSQVASLVAPLDDTTG